MFYGLEGDRKMTPSHQFILGSLVKYGATAVFCVVFYADFVRPMGIEHRAYLAESIEIQRSHTEILTSIVKSQTIQSETLHQQAINQASAVRILKSLQEVSHKDHDDQPPCDPN